MYSLWMRRTVIFISWCNLLARYSIIHSDNFTILRRILYTDVRRLTTGIRYEKYVVVRTSYSVLTQTQTVQYSLLHTYAIRYSLLLLGYKPAQHVTVLNTVGNCNTVVSVIILYYHNLTKVSNPWVSQSSYRYASLNDGDLFWEMRRCANIIQCTYTNLDSTL
jgi:hypothetical protein